MLTISYVCIRISHFCCFDYQKRFIAILCVFKLRYQKSVLPIYTRTVQQFKKLKYSLILKKNILRCYDIVQPKITESLAFPFSMRQRRLSSVTFVRYLVICSLVLIAFMLYFRIEEESLPLNITFSKTPSRKDLAELRTKNLSTPSQQLHSTKSSEYESYGVNNDSFQIDFLAFSFLIKHYNS